MSVGKAKLRLPALKEQAGKHARPQVYNGTGLSLTGEAVPRPISGCQQAQQL